jgi:hypothetical protein
LITGTRLFSLIYKSVIKKCPAFLLLYAAGKKTTTKSPLFFQTSEKGPIFFVVVSFSKGILRYSLSGAQAVVYQELYQVITPDS